jgi:hypothetical protein
MKRQTALLLVLLVATSVAAHAAFTKGRAVQPFTPELKAGEYIWHPEVSPAGPVVVIVSLPKQQMYVYRNGVRIARSTVSSGTKSHKTPTGMFTILQKKVDHESNLYKGAKMPHMQRLTWTGIAMHAGNLPGYPASHGCVRLPVEFAAKLYSVTDNGTSVIITDDKFAPGDTAQPGQLLSSTTGSSTRRLALSESQFEWHPEKSPTGPVSIILSIRDHEDYVYRDGVEIGRAAMSTTGLQEKLGSHVYSALNKFDSDGEREWISAASFGPGRAPNPKQLSQHMTVAPDFLADTRTIVSPGTTLIITDVTVDSETQSGSNFDILDTD